MLEVVRRSALVVFGLALAVWMAAAQAQGQETRQASRILYVEHVPLLQVLTTEEVGQELKLSAEEKAAVKQLVAKDRELRQDARPGSTAAPSADALRARQREEEKRLDAIIGEARLRRVKQMRLQAVGLAEAYFDPVLKEDLGISEEQYGQARDALQAVIAEMQGSFHAARENREGSAKERAKLREKLTPKLLALLTDKQKAEWKKLCGDPVTEKLLAKIRLGPD